MRTSSFNIIHLAIAVFIIVVLIVLLFPMLASLQRDQDGHTRNSQLRGIHQGMVTYSNSNKTWYPGLDKAGSYAQKPQRSFEGFDRTLHIKSQVGIAVQDRYAILLAGEFFTPDYAVSPSETDSAIQPWPGSGPVTSKHYSYAMLQVPQAGGRHDQWKATLNAQSIIMSDRNTGTTQRTSSIHNNDKRDPWRGLVLWNDNHIGFESGPVFETRYGERVFPNDHLFTAEGDDDAYLIHSDN